MNGALSEREPKLIFKLPNAQVPGVLKQIGVDGASNTYILADERIMNGVARTFIQGFGEDGVKRFESQVGPDISNLVVHEAAGLIYVAENSGSSQAKIKSIELATGRSQIYWWVIAKLSTAPLPASDWTATKAFFMLAIQ